jgi:hypothetical protein
MRNTQNWPVGLALTYFAVVIGLVIGWIMNIVALVGGPELAQWTTLEVLRVVGIFVAPLGGVLGWL